MIFLDAAATTPVRREVLEAMWPYLTGEFGNPSSHHSLGEAAATALADARKTVAKVLGCRAGEVTFTSGGTEADNLAVKGIALARQAADPALNRVVISAVEHPAVEESARYLERFHGFTRGRGAGGQHRAGDRRSARRRAPAGNGAGQHHVRQQRGGDGPARRRAGGPGPGTRHPRSTPTPCRPPAGCPWTSRRWAWTR